MRISSVAGAARRALAGARAWLLAPFLAVLAFAAMPRTAHSGEVFAACLEAMDQWYDDCAAESTNWFNDFVCAWVGGLGIILCVVIGFIEKLVESLI